MCFRFADMNWGACEPSENDYRIYTCSDSGHHGTLGDDHIASTQFCRFRPQLLILTLLILTLTLIHACISFMPSMLSIRSIPSISSMSNTTTAGHYDHDGGHDDHHLRHDYYYYHGYYHHDVLQAHHEEPQPQPLTEADKSIIMVVVNALLQFLLYFIKLLTGQH